jgi:hypothetical protein
MQIQKIQSFLIVLLATTLLSACGAATVGQLEKKGDGKQFSPEEVLKLVESNTMLFVSFNEDSFFYFDRSGRVFGVDINKNTDSGKWDVTEDGELCMRLQHWWESDLKCFSVYSDGDKYALANNAGVIAFKAEHFKGDYKNQYREVKTAKKSHRRSIRNQQAGTSAKPERKSADRDRVEPEKPAASSPTPSYVTSDKELKATVKWMARDCPGCNLAKSNLKKADLVGAKLQGANLSGANLSMADLRRADLQSANLENTNLTFANMPGANLRDSNLRNANLKGANLIRADLTGAKLEGINLEGALLEGTVGIP